MALVDIVETASAAGSFGTLLQAATAAGLVDTLKGPGPFTVFAPTDAAFAALPEGTLEGLLADPEALKDILLYHVVSGAVESTAVVGLTSATAVNGDKITITVKDGSVYLNDTVKVVTTDIKASNGIIHVIDAVLLPPAS
ncbi:MAG: fasciclin domain-containing protein [Chloroflexota bacterium]